MANANALPIRIGLFYDFPQQGDLFTKALRMGLDEVAATGRLERHFEFVERDSQGLPAGSEASVVQAFNELRDEGVVAIIGPAISDNALIVAPLCDEARIPASKSPAGSARDRSGCSTTRLGRSRKSRRCWQHA